MVTVNKNGSPVQYTANSGGSFTIAAGEIVVGDLLWGAYAQQSGRTSIDGTTCLLSYDNDGEGYNSSRVVLSGGQTVTSDDDGSVTLTGYDVSSFIDNTQVTREIGYNPSGSNYSFTVPSGEVWDGTLILTCDTSSTFITLNNNEIARLTDEGAATFVEVEVVLTGGDTIEAGSQEAGIFFSGFKV